MPVLKAQREFQLLSVITERRPVARSRSVSQEMERGAHSEQRADLGGRYCGVGRHSSDGGARLLTQVRW